MKQVAFFISIDKLKSIKCVNLGCFPPHDPAFELNFIKLS